MYSKVLILALSGIGDALMFTPALKKLKEIEPEYEIDALVMFPGVKDIYERLPDINNVIHFDFLKEGALKSLSFLFGLRNKYDITINVYPSNRKEYNVINFLLNGRKKVAAKYLRKDFENLGFLNNVRVTESDDQHNVVTNVKLIEKLTNQEVKVIPGLQFPLNDEDNFQASNFLKKINVDPNDLIIGFHPGCATLKNHIKRRWEPIKFVELGRKLINDQNAKIFVFGGPEEKELKNEIVNKINSNKAFIVDTKSLAHSAAVMKYCNLFVTNDSSLMHVSSALGLNVVAIIGPTNKNYIHPWNTEHKIISLNLECSPCFFYSPRPLICNRKDVKFKCIKELSVEMVYTKTLEFIDD